MMLLSQFLYTCTYCKGTRKVIWIKIHFTCHPIHIFKAHAFHSLNPFLCTFLKLLNTRWTPKKAIGTPRFSAAIVEQTRSVFASRLLILKNCSYKNTEQQCIWRRKLVCCLLLFKCTKYLEYTMLLLIS